MMTPVLLAAVVGLCGSPDLGFDFVTIGDPGNRGATAAEVFNAEGVGSVAQAFRITRTEVLTGQYIDFLIAYAQHQPGPLPSSARSQLIRPSSTPVGYAVVPGTEQVPVWDVDFHMALRYANWLHNDQGSDLDDFERGVYDLSQTRPTRAPDARYWIPSWDEMTKALYWDPDKDGVGGYWQYPNSSDSPSIPGPPDSGGQTNAGYPLGVWQPAGQYPDVQSPWGLLDGSGGQRELTDTIVVSGFAAVSLGAVGGSNSGTIFDQISAWNILPSGGFRIATRVPAPTTTAALAALLLPGRRRR